MTKSKTSRVMNKCAIMTTKSSDQEGADHYNKAKNCETNRATEKGTERGRQREREREREREGDEVETGIHKTRTNQLDFEFRINKLEVESWIMRGCK